MGGGVVWGNFSERPQCRQWERTGNGCSPPLGLPAFSSQLQMMGKKYHFPLIKTQTPWLCALWRISSDDGKMWNFHVSGGGRFSRRVNRKHLHCRDCDAWETTGQAALNKHKGTRLSPLKKKKNTQQKTKPQNICALSQPQEKKNNKSRSESKANLPDD